MLTGAEEVMRSAYAIAQRKGKDTNWDAFSDIAAAELLRKQGIDPKGTVDEQTLLRATCTPKTFQLPSEEPHYLRQDEADRWYLLPENEVATFEEKLDLDDEESQFEMNYSEYRIDSPFSLKILRRQQS